MVDRDTRVSKSLEELVSEDRNLSKISYVKRPREDERKKFYHREDRFDREVATNLRGKVQGGKSFYDRQRSYSPKRRRSKI